MKQFRIDQLEANLERFKIDQAAINSEAAKQWAFLQATIEKNKVEADRQFAEIMNALKALQPPTTIPPLSRSFEENRRQSFQWQGGLHDWDMRGGSQKKCDPGITGVQWKEKIVVTWNLSINYIHPKGTGNFCLNSFIESNIMNNHVFQHFRPDDRHERRAVKRRVWDPGITGGRGEDRVTWNLGINYHPSERKWNFCLNSFIESNIMNNHVFQHFRPDDRHERRTVKRRVGSGGNYRRQCFKGAHVTEVADECGGKNLRTFKDLDTEDICTCVGVLESANSQDSTNPTWAGDQSRIREKDVPSHGPRKRH
ncbi:hypothetical protein Tco_1312755 [Tanacetum coccineum]